MYYLSITLLENSFRKKWTFPLLGREFGFIDFGIGYSKGIVSGSTLGRCINNTTHCLSLRD